MAGNDILKQAEADFQAAREELAAAQEQVKVAQEREQTAFARTQEMQAVLDWVQRHSPLDTGVTAAPEPSSPTAAEPSMRFGKPVAEVSNTDLCLRVLESLGRPATTTEIRERLAREGYDLNQEQIRGALKYLARKAPSPVETSTGSGVWKLKDAGHPSRPSDRPALNGAGREA